MKGCLKILGIVVVLFIFIPSILKFILGYSLKESNSTYIPNTEFISPDQDFSVIFPNTFKLLTIFKTTLWVSEMDGEIYSIVRAIPKGSSQDQAADNLPTDLENITIRVQGDWYGYVRYIFTGTDKDGYTIHGYLYYSPSKSNTFIIMVGNKDTKLTNKGTFFLDSFKILR